MKTLTILLLTSLTFAAPFANAVDSENPPAEETQLSPVQDSGMQGMGMKHGQHKGGMKHHGEKGKHHGKMHGGQGKGKGHGMKHGGKGHEMMDDHHQDVLKRLDRIEKRQILIETMLRELLLSQN